MLMMLERAQQKGSLLGGMPRMLGMLGYGSPRTGRYLNHGSSTTGAAAASQPWAVRVPGATPVKRDRNVLHAPLQIGIHQS